MQIIYEKKITDPYEGMIAYGRRNGILFCSKCRKPVELDQDKPEGWPDNIPLYYCPDCGKRTTPYFYSGQPIDTSWDVTIGTHPKNVQTYEGITYNEENNVVSYTTGGFEWLQPISVNNLNFLKIPYLNRISVNLTTGRAYLFAKGNLVSEENMHRRIEWTGIPARVGHIVDNIEVSKIFLDTLIEKTGIPMQIKIKKLKWDTAWVAKEVSVLSATVGDKTIYSLRNLSENGWNNIGGFVSTIIKIVLNPNVYISYDGFKNEAQFRDKVDEEICSYNPTGTLFGLFAPTTREFRTLQPRKLMDEGTYIKEMVSALNIPGSKRFMKMYRKNPISMGVAARIKKAGFKKLDNIYTMLEYFEQIGFWNKELEKDTFNFFNYYIKERGETELVSKISKGIKDDKEALDDIVYTIPDAAREFSIIRKNNLDNPALLNGTLREMHDAMDIICRKIKMENKEIPLTTKEKSRIFENDRYQILPAENTHRLVDLSVKMHHCVQSYSEDALQKRCTIYYMVDKESGKYEACIEMKKNILRQAKGNCNARLTGEVYQTLEEWVKKENIITDGCYDFIRNKKIA